MTSYLLPWVLVAYFKIRLERERTKYRDNYLRTNYFIEFLRSEEI